MGFSTLLHLLLHYLFIGRTGARQRATPEKIPKLLLRFFPAEIKQGPKECIKP